VRAKATTFAGNRVNLKIPDGVKPAHVLAQATLGALVFINERNLPAPELIILPEDRSEQQVQVSRIHITISQHLAWSQGSQGTDDTGLSGSSLTA